MTRTRHFCPWLSLWQYTLFCKTKPQSSWNLRLVYKILKKSRPTRMSITESSAELISCRKTHAAYFWSSTLSPSLSLCHNLLITKEEQIQTTLYINCLTKQTFSSPIFFNWQKNAILSTFHWPLDIQVYQRL